MTVFKWRCIVRILENIFSITMYIDTYEVDTLYNPNAKYGKNISSGKVYYADGT